jgi:hypothetical protein
MVEKGFAVLILILLSSGCLIHSTGDTLHVVSVGEQNAVYHFGDRVVINVSVYSPDAIKNITVKLSGLKNKLGQSKIHKSKNVDLEEGDNIISFKCWIPTCSPCNKLYPGSYYINATVMQNGEVIAEGSSIVRLEE